MLQRGFFDRLQSYPAWFARIAGSLRSQRDDIQGLLLNSYAELRYAAFLLLRIRDAERTRAWLRRIRPHLAAASSDAPLRMNVAFTATGLRALGLDEQSLGTFSREFLEGMAAREHLLGDASKVKHWEFGADAEELHLLLMIYGEQRRKVDRVLSTKAELAEAGLECVRAQRAARLKDPRRQAGAPSHKVQTREPFGFEDGISQPILAGFQEALRYRVHPLDRPVLPGEFLLGYVNEDEELPPSPHVPAEADVHGHLPPLPGSPERRDLGHNGTYLVLRKLKQDKQVFRTMTGQHRVGHAAPAQAQARPACPFAQVSGAVRKYLGGSGAGASARAGGALDADTPPRVKAPLLLAAKLLGRWQDGEPLRPDEERPAPNGAGEASIHGFSFRDRDPDGFGSPLTSHIRRANPRDTLPVGLLRSRDSKRTRAEREDSFKTVRRHRILRRGITYADRGGGEGLLFLALNANIRRQFEFIQQIWLGHDNLAGAGRHDAYVTLPGERIRTRVKVDPRVVEVRGGAYFFLPSLKAMDFLAEAPLAH